MNDAEQNSVRARIIDDSSTSIIYQVPGTGITLSANTLFHFTKTKENLIGILKNEFFPRYSLEDDPYSKKCLAIPMVSFCDIPLSQIKNHIQTYGSYAIGLNKNWGRKHKINPVLYTYPESSVIASFRTILDSCEKGDGEAINQIASYCTYMLNYVKIYEGQIYRNGILLPGVIRFYDEREWRYVPAIDYLSKKNIAAFLSEEEFKNTEVLMEYSKKLEDHCRLPFEPRDIKYVITRTESEILELMDIMANIKGDKYSHKDIRLLSSRLISSEQVFDDF
jgi:hypothetical protein